MTHEEIESIVSKAVETTLSRLGIDPDDHSELKADFSHLRRWRKSVEQAQGYTFKIVITTIVGGMLGALWLGIQTMLHR